MFRASGPRRKSSVGLLGPSDWQHWKINNLTKKDRVSVQFHVSQPASVPNQHVELCFLNQLHYNLPHLLEDFSFMAFSLLCLEKEYQISLEQEYVCFGVFFNYSSVSIAPFLSSFSQSK